MLKFMRNKILIPLLILGALAAFFSFKYTGTDITNPEERRKLVIETMMVALQHEHYSPKDLDDTFSARVYKNVMNLYDQDKMYFIEPDIKTLKSYQFSIDDQIKNNSIDFFDSFDAIIQRRIDNVEKFYPELLEKPFDFSKDERKVDDAASEQHAKDLNELKSRWLVEAKRRVLEKYVDLKDAQDKKKKDSASYAVKTDAELELQARESVKKMFARQFKSMRKINSDKRFTFYVNAITETEDPHSSYLPPREKKSFDEQMSGSFFGIGAQLRENADNGKISVASVIPGSPSWKQGELKADDEILKVAQGSKTPVDIQGFELDDVVKLIRGDKGTEVRITVKKPDGVIKEIPIIRGVVTLDDVFAKSAVVNTKDGKIGYIRLPEFYSDFNHTSQRRCAIDIRDEVIKLKAEGVNGIILDLRYNGGGSLGDVVDMTGIFVGRGPVVQVKSSTQNINVYRSQSYDTAIYTGPLIIMVNEMSASASEILAAALQDYKRAVIVGSPTYGKGTVQKMIGLDQLLNPMLRMQLQNDTSLADPSIGSLKLTMEKFYRVNGQSTQLKGVTPDIRLPDAYAYADDDDIGERRSKSALPYDQINPANYRPMNSYTDLSDLAKMSRIRIENNPSFNALKEVNDFRLEKMKNKSYPLGEKQYRSELEQAVSMNKKLEEVQKKITPLEMVNIKADLEKINIDSVSINKNKDWLKDISKDAFLAETVNIMNDLAKSSMNVSIKRK